MESARFKLKDLQNLIVEKIETEDSERRSKRDNVPPKTWGPAAWRFIDHIVTGYPTDANRNEKSRMLDFIMSLREVLPCEQCRENFREFLKKNPPTSALSSRRQLKSWFQKYRNSKPHKLT